MFSARHLPPVRAPPVSGFCALRDMASSSRPPAGGPGRRTFGVEEGRGTVNFHVLIRSRLCDRADTVNTHALTM